MNNISNIAVVSKNLDDYLKWVMDYGLIDDGSNKKHNLITCKGKRYYPITHIIDSRGYGFNGIIETNYAKENKNYSVIINMLKAHLNTPKRSDYVIGNEEDAFYKCDKCDVKDYCYSLGENAYAFQGECLTSKQPFKLKVSENIIKKVEVVKDEIKLDAFHYHEILDRLAMMTNILEEELYNHCVCSKEPELKNEIRKGIDALVNAYQIAGYLGEKIKK